MTTGAGLSDPVAVEPIPDPIDRDLPCAVCGYNLKGMAHAANCPECGRPVARTVIGDLHLSEPAWLRAQARNLFFLGALAFLSSRYADISYWDFGWPYRIAYLVTLLPNALAMALTVYAAFRLSGPEAAPSIVDRVDDPWRRGLRFTCVAYVAAFTLLAIPATLTWKLRPLIGIIQIAATVALQWLVPFFLNRLARRTLDRTLHLHARLVLWAMPLQAAATMGIGLLGAMMTWTVAPNVVLTLLHITGSAVTLGYLSLLGRMYEALWAAARVGGGEAPLPPEAWGRAR